MSNINIGPSAAAHRSAAQNNSPASAKDAAPAFSRSAGVARPLSDSKIHDDAYTADPFPRAPHLIGGTLVNGRILNQSYAQEALSHDLARLVNDLAHGKTEKASERVKQMSMVDLGDHLKDFRIDPQLFARLSEVVDDKKLTPQQIQVAVHDVLLESGAARFMKANPTSKPVG